MAFLAADPNQDPNDPKNKQGASQDPNSVIGTANNSGPTLGGSSAPIEGSGSAAGATPTASGSFTNLQKYADANKGNDAAMGAVVGGTVQGSADQANAAGKSFQESANKDIGQHTVGNNQDLIGSLNNIGGGGAGTVNKDEFNKQYNADYAASGGKEHAADFGGYADTSQAYKNTQDLGNLAGGDFNDRGTLLNKTYARGGQQYSQGEGALDSFVLGANQGGRDSLKATKDKFGNYTNEFKNLSGAVDTQAAAAKATTAATRDNTRAVADQAVKNVDSRLGEFKRTADIETAGNKNRKTLFDNLDVPTLKSAGYSDDAINILKAQGGDPTLANQGKDFSAGDIAAASGSHDVDGYRNLLALINGAAPGTMTDKYGTQLDAAGGVDSVINKNAITQYNQKAVDAKAAQHQAILDASSERAARDSDAENAKRAAEQAAYAAAHPQPSNTPTARAGVSNIDTSGNRINIGAQNPNAPTISSVDMGNDPTGYHPAGPSTNNTKNGNETGIDPKSFPGLLDMIKNGNYVM